MDGHSFRDGRLGTTAIKPSGLIQEALSCISGSRALGLALRLQYGAIDDLKDRLKFNPLHHLDQATARFDLLSIELIRKWVDLPGSSPSDRCNTALAGDIVSEHRCLLTNLHLRAARVSGTYAELLFISRVQSKIASWIGNSPLGWEDYVSWGPGATATLSSRNAVLDNKLLERQLSVTSSALVYAQQLISEDLHWLRARLGEHVDGPASLLPTEFLVTDANRLELAPKDAFKDRIICCEPTLNIFLQKGVGSLLRSYLRKAGCNLNDQTRNQRLAKLAYKAGLATVDLSAASDSLSRELVHLLLPPAWVELLDDLRSPCTSLPDASIKKERRVRRNEKFSSMGNGFTFELESLIFYAIASVVSDSPLVAVYGDDIIVPQSDAASLINWLRYFGFETNVQKTYVSGNYYESCGKHYFQGRDVTPVYQKSSLLEESEIVRFHNRLYRYWGFAGQYIFRPVLARLRAMTKVRMHVSEEGDHGCLTNDVKLVRWKTKENDFQALAFKSLVLVTEPVKNRYYVPSAYLAVVMRQPGYLRDGPISDGLPFRSTVRVTKKVRVRPVV